MREGILTTRPETTKYERFHLIPCSTDKRKNLKSVKVLSPASSHENHDDAETPRGVTTRAHITFPYRRV